MNIYTKKSIDLANKAGYLDKLLTIYSVQKAELRDIPQYIQEEVRDKFKKKDKKKLLDAFLETERFPFDDPYIASFRNHRYLINKNPKNFGRVSDRLFFYGSADDLIKMASEPKSPSKQFGSVFKNWIIKLGLPSLEENTFINSSKGAFLLGTEKYLNDFSIRNLKVKPEKRPDFIFKKKDIYYIGEAKFISNYGGAQDNQVDKALSIARINNNNVRGIAIFDGIIWFSSNNKMHKKIENSEDYILSALLLKEFLNKL